MTFENYKTNTKVTKTVMFATLIMTLMVPLSGINMANAVIENVSSNTLGLPEVVPDAPTTLGCYHYTKVAGWVTVACSSKAEMEELQQYRPTIGGSSGVRGEQVSSGVINYGLTDVKFSTYSGESDSLTGTTNTWSIQTNTDTWRNGGVGDFYTVQFVEQNHSTNSNIRKTCIWQIDVTTQNYSNTTCINVPLQTLSSTYEGSVEGKVLANGSLQAQFCNIAGTTQCWVVVATDANQLGTHWTQSSGTILGLGAASSANFVSHATEVTKVKISPATSGNIILSTTTQETNNLTYGTPSSSCAFGICTMTVTSSN